MTLPASMPNEEYVAQVLADMAKLIAATIQVSKVGPTFHALAQWFGVSEPIIHQAVCALGCAVDEDIYGFLVMSTPTYSPPEAAKRFLQGKEM